MTFSFGFFAHREMDGRGLGSDAHGQEKEGMDATVILFKFFGLNGVAKVRYVDVQVPWRYFDVIGEKFPRSSRAERGEELKRKCGFEIKNDRRNKISKIKNICMIPPRK